MNSPIQQFLNENQNFNNQGKPRESNNGTISIALNITGYEGKYFVGTNLDTKEEIKILLRDVPQKNEKNKRIEVEEFSNPSNYKRYVEPNNPKSIILFDNCYKEQDGTWNSRWANTLSTPKKPAHVVIQNANINIIKQAANEILTVSFIKDIVPIKNNDDFYKVLVTGLMPKRPRSRPYLVFRFKDTEGQIFTQQFRPKLDNEKNVLDPNTYINELWTEEATQKLLQLVNNPSVETDCFIFTSMLFGGDTSVKILNNNFEREVIKNDYSLEVEGQTYPKRLFKKTIITIRTRPEDNSPFVISAKPVENRKAGIPIEEI